SSARSVPNSSSSRNGSRSGSCGPPITRVSLTPAPSDAGVPRSLRAMRAWDAVVFMGGSCAGTGMMGAAGGRLQAREWNGRLRGYQGQRPWSPAFAGMTADSPGATGIRHQPPGTVDAGVAGEVDRDGAG